MKIADFAAELVRFTFDGDEVALWRVADLERHVDRTALLGGENPPEPPYWAHLWSGALVLARAVPRGSRHVLELGCGLGLPGLVAARRGAQVTFVDRIPAALAFVRASAAATGVPVTTIAADVTAPALAPRFDLVLAAELLYDRSAFAPLAAALARHIAPGGRALLTDAGRTDTRDFYAALSAIGLAWAATEHVVREERLPVTIRLVDVCAQRGS
jgi:predicted nicotinamide N-methyase